jgi:hypothetical protein
MVDQAAAGGATAGPATSGPSRAELELGLRAAHLAIAELREDLHALAAQVVALTELVAPAAEPAREAQLEARAAELRRELAISDQRSTERVRLAPADDKYALANDDGPPCDELLPICGARCCTFEVALSTQDLDEGQLRWNYASPYLLAKQAHGQCAHHDGAGCQVYAFRPATCRTYDCRSDERVWSDYAQRLLAPSPSPRPPTREALERGVLARAQAFFVEAERLRRRR